MTKEMQNAPLKAEMESKGCKLITKDGKQYFVDKEGKYANFPVGYITGPSKHDREGFYMSVYGVNGWSQRSGHDIYELEKWAVERSRRNLEGLI